VNASLGSGALCARLLLDAEKIAGFRAEAVVEQTLKPVPASRRGRMTVLERDERHD